MAVAIVERWPLWRGCQYGATFQNNNNNNLIITIIIIMSLLIKHYFTNCLERFTNHYAKSVCKICLQ